MRPSYEQFVAALRDPQQRAGIGLVIGDEDAASLLSRADWATAYFEKWLGMFPAEPVVAAPAAATPFVAPVAASSAAPAVVPAAQVTAASAPAPAYLSDPPPVYATTSIRTSSSPDFAPVPLWAPDTFSFPTERRGLPRGARIALIAAASVIVVAALGGIGLGVLHGLTPTALAGHAATGSSSGTTPSSGKYGLTAQEYELMEAVVAPYGKTLEQRIAAGMTEAQLRTATDTFEGTIAKTCTDAASLNGWSSASFKASFEAGFEAQTKATPQQAERVFLALANYCTTK